MSMTNIVQRMRDIFRFERRLPRYKLSESDHLQTKHPGMTEELKELRDFIYELQAQVIEAAQESGVTINPQARDARESAIAAQGEDEYEETAAMFFEDVLTSLEMARVMRFEGHAAQWATLIETANTTRESIKFLREVFKIGLDEAKEDPLRKLIDVEFMLRDRVDKIEKISASERETSIYRTLEEKVFEAAEVVGIAINKDNRVRLAVEDDENCQGTPQMFFEDVLDELDLLETARRYRLDKELDCARSAAVTTSESIEFLRGIHHIDPLTKLEEVEDKLWNRVRELEAKRDHFRTPG